MSISKQEIIDSYVRYEASGFSYYVVPETYKVPLRIVMSHQNYTALKQSDGSGKQAVRELFVGFIANGYMEHLFDEEYVFFMYRHPNHKKLMHKFAHIVLKVMELESAKRMLGGN
ncbi:hypothetical protein [Pseudomonas sp.]|uniref:hypothetical protein n=1 Tax=Pseudomonas sp. TaxID=306 RepID=UPI00262CBAA9|nr:hypothetical protein [Pseudomonas sp.]